ncbi:Predicted ATPase [Bosea lupini]|uniref:Predicted ATPase n=1 Tax=Bosea lupini TaxID=1036779 RepID=A0A1H7W9C1_9HYPH|nr:winged helix-turn-helix domain-containing protein [Bosea lupini]SEM18156.1 Predicted ATPase [Bosea lupini]
MNGGSDLTNGRRTFGPFILTANERLLTRHGVPIELGARALDLLIVLTSKPNQVLGKRELLARVWPDVTVEEGSLRFHMAGLRKALGDGQDGARYITTLAGQGYCFVAPVHDEGAKVASPLLTTGAQHANLPVRLSRMIGRDRDVETIAAELTQSRFVTILGPGGVGKTTVAVAVAHVLKEAFGGATVFVDLAMLTDANLVATALSSMLGQPVQSQDATSALVSFLGPQRILLVLDTCEHLLDTVASLAAAILDGAPGVHILATSREAIRIEDERVYRMDALACPPDDSELTAETLQHYPATRLFIERATASGAKLDLDDESASLVAAICRKLDGLALAIELAARRIESHGLQQTASLLNESLTRLWLGSRTAPPRHKTLQATLDWSYGLLSEVERSVLCRLAVFVGNFTLDAALDVATSAEIDRASVFNAIDSLVAKSVLAVRPTGAMTRYRLLDTTRAYALDIPLDRAEKAAISRRHAGYYRRWLQQTEEEWRSLTTGAERQPYFAGLNNARLALEWCFGEDGDVPGGIALAAAATPVFLAMSLLPECQRWSQRAIQALDATSGGGLEEMQLQAHLGLSLMYTSGHGEAPRAALERAVWIAAANGDRLSEARLLGPLFFYHFRCGDIRMCMQHARRSVDIAETLGEPGASALSFTLMGICLTVTGEVGAGLEKLDRAIADAPATVDGWSIHFGFDAYRWNRLAHIMALSLGGRTKAMREAVDGAFRDAIAKDHPMSLATTINSTAALLLVGAVEAAESHLNWFVSRAELNSLQPYLDLGRAFRAELAIGRGDLNYGVTELTTQLGRLDAARFRLFTVRLRCALARGLLQSCRAGEALAVIDETLRQIETSGQRSFLPEAMRIKGNILLSEQQDFAEGERCLNAALELSRSQGSGVWELRAATDLAGHWATQHRLGDARHLLRPVVLSFADEEEMPDLKAARELLVSLENRP